ncbi:MAG TPA: oligopeptidase B, partial [Actinomycetota bacterium]|nr:oligopeptidase B [Actinomycetota bacterium]
MLTSTRLIALAAFAPAVILAQAPRPQATTALLTPPVAAVRPHRFDEHGNVRVDPYYWLRERDNPEVIKYLQDENAHTNGVMAHTQTLQDRLYEEMKGRVLLNDQSVPFREGNYFYYTRLVEGKNYPIYARKRGSLSAPEEIMIDANALAEGKPTFLIRAWEISSGEDLLAFAVDTTGGRVSAIRFRNLRTGDMLADVIPRSIGGIAWAEDNRTLFYTRPDSVSVRPYQVYRHRLGAPAATDQLVYEDKDETYYVGVFKTKSRAYIMIQSSQTMATEYSYVRADQPDAPFRILIPRQRGHEYHADQFGAYFYILSNDQAKNFRLMRTPVARPGRDNWEEVIPHRPDVLLEDFEFFKDFLVLSERKDGLVQLRVRPWNGTGEFYLDFGEPAYLAFASTNREFDTPLLRYVYTSLTTPSSTYDYDMRTRQKTLLKRDQILGGFDPANYMTERFYTTARDGARVPVS